MAPGSEIERKFLVVGLPDELDTYPAESIEQGYFAIDGPVEARLRRYARSPELSGAGEPAGGARTVLSVKSGTGRVRLEEEIEVDDRCFDSLWVLSEGRRVAKTRYRLPRADGLTIEVDVYAGELAGLATAEVEFESEAASDEFEAPAWFGPEVTGDVRYANRSLAVRGVPGEL